MTGTCILDSWQLFPCRVVVVLISRKPEGLVTVTAGLIEGSLATFQRGERSRSVFGRQLLSVSLHCKALLRAVRGPLA